MYERETERLQKMIEESESIVFFGGAGVSTESGIPDFRSADGIYHQKYRFSPEQVVSHTFFMRYPEAFYEFYKEKWSRVFTLLYHCSTVMAAWKTISNRRRRSDCNSGRYAGYIADKR